MFGLRFELQFVVIIVLLVMGMMENCVVYTECMHGSPFDGSLLYL